LSGKQKVIRSHIEIAEMCLADARLLATAGSRNAAYVAEQCAENLIKAVLTEIDIHVERAKTHQIDTMVRMLPDSEPLKSAFAKVSWLENYATSYRYPTQSGNVPTMPDLVKVAIALEHLQSIVDALRQRYIFTP
jgi:HEPN domain-containing protein